MRIVLAAILACGGGYLIGGIPFGFLAGRLKGMDVRTAGSGNIGATNVGRLLGRRWGIIILLADVAKGLIPVLLTTYLVDSGSLKVDIRPATRDALILAAGIGCILGHNFSPYLGLRGGKGVATSLGVVLGIFPYLTVSGLMAAVVWGAITMSTRYVSLGSISAAVALPVLLAVCLLYGGGDAVAEHWPLLVFAAGAGLMVILRHRSNLSRLQAGTENRLGNREN